MNPVGEFAVGDRSGCTFKERSVIQLRLQVLAAASVRVSTSAALSCERPLSYLKFVNPLNW